MGGNLFFRKQKDGKSWGVYADKNAKTLLALIVADDGNPNTLSVELPDESSIDKQELLKAFQPTHKRYLKSFQKVLIVCEGATEFHYFSEMVQFLNIQKKVEIKVSSKSNPLSSLELVAKDLYWERCKGLEPYSDCWFVFDRDEHHGLDDAIAYAKKIPNFHLILSNPCFEYWLLTHFPEFSGSLPYDHYQVKSRTKTEEPMGDNLVRTTTVEIGEAVTSSQLCIKELLRHWPKYKKGQAEYITIIGKNMRLAIERSDYEMASKTKAGSQIPILLDELFSIAGKSREEVLQTFESELLIRERVASTTDSITYLHAVFNQFIRNKELVVSKKLREKIIKHMKVIEDNLHYENIFRF